MCHDTLPHRRAVLIAFVITALLGAASGYAEEASDVIQNWTAPPFWHAVNAPAASSGRTAMAGSSGTALPFIALPPCRLVDTRGNAPLTGGFLPAATVRTYTLAGVCNVPGNASAISLNATVTNPAGPGFLTLYPKGGTFPPVSTLNYLLGQTIVNAAVVPLSSDGSISVVLGCRAATSSSTRTVLRAAFGVTSLNTQTET